MEKKIKHMEFIQGVINRLATNSFQMKGWAVVLVSAILVLVAREDRLDAACIALVPVVVFWGLDGYFLWQERLFRTLYNHVRKRNKDDTDFSLEVCRFRKGHIRSIRGWLCATFSPTLGSFYGMLIVTIFFATLIDRLNQGDANGSQGVLQLPL